MTTLRFRIWSLGDKWEKKNKSAAKSVTGRGQWTILEKSLSTVYFKNLLFFSFCSISDEEKEKNIYDTKNCKCNGACRRGFFHFLFSFFKPYGTYSCENQLRWWGQTDSLSWSLLLLKLKRDFPPHCHQVLTHSASLKYCKLLLLLCEAPGDKLLYAVVVVCSTFKDMISLKLIKFSGEQSVILCILR